jgi:hypothetical protein
MTKDGDKISRILKRAYDSVVQEPVPVDMLALLDKLA